MKHTPEELQEIIYQKNRVENRSKELLSAFVSNTHGDFDADEKSMDRMSRVIGSAASKFNEVLSQGLSYADAYNAVYLGIIVSWKNRDNIFIDLTIEDICKLQEQALNNVQVIWTKWG